MSAYIKEFEGDQKVRISVHQCCVSIQGFKGAKLEKHFSRDDTEWRYHIAFLGVNLSN